jgi:hypothetical protein
MKIGLGLTEMFFMNVRARACEQVGIDYLIHKDTKSRSLQYLMLEIIPTYKFHHNFFYITLQFTLQIIVLHPRQYKILLSFKFKFIHNQVC